VRGDLIEDKILKVLKVIFQASNKKDTDLMMVSFWDWYLKRVVLTLLSVGVGLLLFEISEGFYFLILGIVVLLIWVLMRKTHMEHLSLAGILMIMIGSLSVFFLLIHIYYGYLGIWTLHNVILSFAFVICGWQLLKKRKKWAATGGIFFSFIDSIIIFYFNIHPFFKAGIFFLFDPFWILVLVMWTTEIMIIVLIALNWSRAN
jgi:hypothetical protein